ncbi:MAG: matrixin family metalloprotease [Verrucomicrobia bacterium]|nr:MAG: matrixin family metalloprotease [Verrucomicrobiota bacterium]
MNRRALTFFLAAIAIAHAHAYVLNLDSASQPRRWAFYSTPYYISTNVINTNTHAVRYYLASDAYSTTNTAAELNAVRASFGQWTAITNTSIKFEEPGLVAPPVDANTYDNSNIVYWAKSSTLVASNTYDITGTLGFTVISWYPSPESNYIAQADIVFNGVNFTWFTDIADTNTTKQFVEGVALHEIGHFLGLAHSPLGGASMFWRGGGGVNTQTGLSPDDISAARILYPASALTNLGTLKGTITKSGSPVLGAAVYLETTGSNVIAATVSRSDGTYQLNALTPGNYFVRAAPLDAYVSPRLAAGPDISSDFNSADTSFLPTANTSVTLTANTTNTVDFAVTSGTPAFRITRIRTPTTTSGAYSINSTPVSLRAGQSNYFVSVFSADLPTSGATFTISGDGLTLGSPSYQPGTVFVGLNGISMSISVSSNATPGLRDFIVTQGANVAYANGFFEVLATNMDYNFDGFDDVFQRTYFAPWTSTNAAPAADPDHDGYNNYAEFISGTVPTNSASYLKVLSTTTTGSGTTVKWTGSAGKRYQLTSRTNMASAPWQNLGGVFTASNSAPQFLDTSATNGMRFYRVQALP